MHRYVIGIVVAAAVIMWLDSEPDVLNPLLNDSLALFALPLIG